MYLREFNQQETLPYYVLSSFEERLVKTGIIERDFFQFTGSHATTCLVYYVPAGLLPLPIYF